MRWNPQHRRAVRIARLVGLALTVSAPALAHARKPEFGTVPSGRLDLGPAWNHAPSERPTFSLLAEVGAAFMSNDFDAPLALYIRPALGYRYHHARPTRNLAELSLEFALGVPFVTVADGGGFTPIAIGYRVGGVMGTQRLEDGPRAFAGGVRHGPIIPIWAGAGVLSFSHEYLAAPTPTQGLRVGFAIDISPVIWFGAGGWW